MVVPSHIPSPAESRIVAELNDRSREIFRQIVESYLATGEPLGSRNLSRILPITLSPASIRNVMADREAAGLIFAPHNGAGRLSTEVGQRFVLDAMLDCVDVRGGERAGCEA
jgi:heat-inducible transcriptional repressor